MATGGGGGGVEIDGQVYLLDLVQANQHLSPYYRLSPQNPNVEVISTHFLNMFQFKDILSRSEVYVQSRLAIKVAEIIEIDPVLGWALIEVVRNLTWSLVETDFKLTADMQADVFIDGEILPLAIRQGQNVYIHRQRWQKMDDENKAALILHEVLSAFSGPNYQPIKIRQFIGDLYSVEFSVRTRKFKESRIEGLPNLSSLVAFLKSQLSLISDCSYISRKEALAGYGIKNSSGLFVIQLKNSGLVESPNYFVTVKKAEQNYKHNADFEFVIGFLICK